MSSQVLAAIFMLLAFAATASAQDQIRGNFFGGYSFANADLGSGSKVGLHGYEVSSEFNPLPWLGVIVDNDGHFGSASVPFCFGGNANTCTASGPTNFAHLYTFSGGPRFLVAKGRFMPSARALFGVATLDACPIQGCESKGTFAQTYGGAIDVRASRRVGWRFQADFLKTRFFGRRQSDARFSTGLLIFFYKHSH